MYLKPLFASTLFLLLLFASASTRAADAPPARWDNARIDDIADDRSSLTVTECPTATAEGKPDRTQCRGERSVKTLSVEAALRPELKSYLKGDHVNITFGDKKVPTPEKSVAEKTAAAEKVDAAKLLAATKKECKDKPPDAPKPAEPAPAKTLDGDLKSMTIVTASVDSGTRIWVLSLAAGLLFLFAALVSLFKPLRFLIGQDGRYSNSKTQIALWFWIVLATYLSTVYLRMCTLGWDFFGSVNIPKNLLLISGMSAITYGGAKAITTAKADAANDKQAQSQAAQAALAHTPASSGADAEARVKLAAMVTAAPPKKTSQPPAQASFLKDLTQNDTGAFDLGDFQMLTITVIAVGMYVTLVFNFLGLLEARHIADLPNVDTTILGVFVLGHSAYLAKKAGGNLGSS